MNSGRTAVLGNDLYIGNSSNSPVQLGLKSEIDSCFQSVSNGKSLIASAITGKGVSTASDATFQTMANNINAISQLNTSDANASAAQILSGYIAYVKGSKITGSMTNRGAVTSSLNCGGSYTIPAGYHNGSGKVSANSLAAQTQASATAAQILSGYTAWVNGTRLTGTMIAGINLGSAAASSSVGSSALQLSEGTIKQGFVAVISYSGSSSRQGVSVYLNTNPSSSSMTIIASARNSPSLTYMPNGWSSAGWRGQIFSASTTAVSISVIYW